MFDAAESAKLPARKSATFEINAIVNDYNSRNLGRTYLQFIYDKESGSWTRADKIVGAEILSEAAYVYAGGRFRSDDRHSVTTVAVKIYEGQYVARMNRGGTKVTALWQMRENPENKKFRLFEVDYSHVRNAEGGWDIKVKDADGALVEILPSLRS